MNEQGRRGFLAGAGAGAGALVVGFDTSRRSWVTEAQAATGAVVSVPGLDGELVTDAAALDEAADDFGHIVHRRPIAVLRPGSYEDVAKLVRFANKFGLKLAGRGEGHSTFGQAQARGGFVIDMRTLGAVHEVGPGGAVVDAGARWSAVLGASLPAGLTPRVLTDYLETSAGGTLSVGGIGGATHRFGLQIDNVEALEVVTGEGKLVRCSPSERPSLFQSALGGLGQFGVIARATLSLKPAPTRARVYTALYADLAAYVADQSALALDERFDYLEGQIVPDGAGGWAYLLEAGAYFTPPEAPDEGALLAGLAFDPATLAVAEYDYFDWLNRLAPVIEQFYIPSGFWFTPHPLCDLFLPASQAAAFAAEVAATLEPEDIGPGVVLFYPFRRSKLKRPFLAVPDEEVLFLISFNRFPPADPAVVEGQIAQNRAFYERARDLGAKRYAISAVPFSPADWVDHFGPRYLPFLAQKLRYDPRFVLTPGQGIFFKP